MSLPMPWVEKIFVKLTLVYGRDFAARWEGMNIVDVKEDWAHELSGLDSSPKAIVYALQNLPATKAPTVLEFRSIARKMPQEAEALDPLVRLAPDVVAGHIANIKKIPKPAFLGNKEWAHLIVARHAAGDRISHYSLKLAQAAIAPFMALSAA